MLELRDLTGGWGPTTVIENLSLSVGRGETVAIIGRNGVGKSTLLELIVGRAQRKSGTILLDGQPIEALPVYRRVAKGLGYVPQEREIFASLNVEQHLTITARRGSWDKERIYALFPSLARRRDTLARFLSGGEQQMLAISRALVANPRLLIMDEPSEGLAPVVVDQLVEAVRAVLADRDLAVLLVEQRVDIALEFSSRCLVMDRGRVIHEGPSAELGKDPGKLSDLMGFAEEGSA